MSRPSEACPVCGKPATGAFAPFCSKRCADIDLGRWLKGGYVIPAGPAPNPAENGPQDDPEKD
ncbi:MAG TPA: DNA gyrase inhibitor YacG [Rhizomicrobium sp.]|jgi:hypothetical protein|nr:DNA gyrase inhibitor YacG [Rhizomicrobium sp.]